LFPGSSGSRNTISKSSKSRLRHLAEKVGNDEEDYFGAQEVNARPGNKVPGLLETANAEFFRVENKRYSAAEILNKFGKTSRLVLNLFRIRPPNNPLCYNTHLK